MKYVKQIGVILGITMLGEVLYVVLPLPVPAGVYGLFLMLGALISGLVKLESVEGTGNFLLDTMSMMFIPATVGIVESFEEVKKVLVLSPSGKVDEVRRDLGDRYNIVDNTVGLKQSDMAEICLMGVDKGSGIKTILSYFGDDRKSSVGVGDGANDIEMIEYCGLGIAMGNADERLKEKADWITGDVNQDGLKKAIEFARRDYLSKLTVK